MCSGFISSFGWWSTLSTLTLQNQRYPGTIMLKLSEKLMGLSVFSSFVVVFLVVLVDIQAGFVEGDVYGKNYISWEDLKVDEHEAGLNTRDATYEQSRIIMVDKNGGGDSLTVQGAVDMVPELNTQRVKIFIHPGIYR